ncbi:MAG TPA: SRPBCC family protein [Burkholderiales bacterium]
MKTAILGATCLFAASLPAAAQGILNSHESIEIRAPAGKVWDAVKDFDSLHNWHPMFSGGTIKSGGNNEVGTVRTMTVKDGPSFDEELLSFDALDRRFSYRLIDPVPLPVSHYVGTFQVIEGRRGPTIILWNSAYRNNSGGKMKDEEVIAFINGAFRVGLENVKSLLEAK